MKQKLTKQNDVIQFGDSITNVSLFFISLVARETRVRLNKPICPGTRAVFLCNSSPKDSLRPY